MSSRSDKKTSIITLGAAGLGLGLIAYMLYSYTGGGSGSYTGGGSGGGGEYYLPTMAAGGYTPTPSISAGGGSGSGGLDLSGILGGGTTTANAPSISGGDIATKKAITSSQNETMQALVSGAGYQQLSQQQIGQYNQSLAALLASEERTGGGSLQSAVSFMGIGSGAVGIANIPNATGISNAGQNLTSVIYDTGAYEVRDWRGNIVSSGSAGAVSGSGGGSSSSGGGSSSVSKKESVNITADKATAIKPFTTATLSTGGTYAAKSGTAYSYSGGSSSSSKKSSVSSSGGFSQGGAVRSNTTAGKYTGVK